MLTKVEQFNDKHILKNLYKGIQLKSACISEVIRIDKEVKKKAEGQYQRNPSESSPGEYRLGRKGNAKEVRFKFLEKDRGGEVKDARARSN